MKFAPAIRRKGKRQKGWALLAVMTLAACGLMLLAGVMNWANENATMASRNNEYFATTYAAEAATEKVLSTMVQQYRTYQFAAVNANMGVYPTILPTGNDSSVFTNYQFGSGSTVGQLIVSNTATSQTNIAGAPYSGLTLVENTYQIIANAQNMTTGNNIVSTIGQEVYLGTIPLFQFAIFYQNVLEMSPGSAMTINGAVHANSSIYLDPADGLTLAGDISSTGQVVLGENPLDPTSRVTSPVTFDGAQLNGVNPLTLPVGTNTTGSATNVSDNVYGILKPPTPDETASSASGTNLLYNKADLIIVISNNNNVYVTSGAQGDTPFTPIPQSQWSSFMSTNGMFYDQRDNLDVNPMTLNVSNLLVWSGTNTILRSILSNVRGSQLADVQSVYLDDQRAASTIYATNLTTTTYYPAAGSFVAPVTTNLITKTTTTRPIPGTYVGAVTTTLLPLPIHYTYSMVGSYTYQSITETLTQPGVVLTNGAVLPPQGLSIATPDPAYIAGNWNVQSSTNAGSPSDAGSSDVTHTLPSAIYSDAITILSQNWNPSNSAAALSFRTATNDTVNAAFLTGNVPSDGTTYSGGVENFPRFLENWTGSTFTYNGSMVCMFDSQIANAPYPGTGTVYNPPIRNWAFDTNFSDPSKDPPLMPQVITVQRSRWALLAPFSTSF